MHGALASALERWREHIILEKQISAHVFKVVQGLMNGALVSAFGAY